MGVKAGLAKTVVSLKIIGIAKSMGVLPQNISARISCIDNEGDFTIIIRKNGIFEKQITLPALGALETSKPLVMKRIRAIAATIPCEPQNISAEIECIDMFGNFEITLWNRNMPVRKIEIKELLT